MKTPTPKAVKKPMPKPKGKSKTCDSPPQNSTIPAPNLSKSASNLSGPIPKPPLTGKQQLFVEEYLVDLNATQAAVRAGYSVRTARQVGCRLLTYVDIKAAIEAAIEERKKRITVTGDMVIAELALIAFAGMKDFVEIDEGGAIRAFPLDTLAEGKDRIIRKVREKRTIKSTADGDQVLDSIYEFELVDKIKSLELLARHMGLLHDKTEIDVRQPVIIEIVKFAK
jgi:phage terminase small subunit